ncbi:unnamed protein product [Bathycoccus prasinos]
MKRILCAVPKTTMCGSTTREGKMNNNNNNNNDMNTTNTNKGGGGENKNWSNAYEKFRKEASDLTEEEAKELWRKTKQCMAQEDEVQLRLYAELDLIYGSDDDDEDDGEEEEEAVENNLNNTTTTNNNNNKTNNARSKQLLKRNSQRHKDLVHERVRIALANEIRQKAIEADSVDPFDMIMSSSDQSLKKVGLSRIRSSE